MKNLLFILLILCAISCGQKSNTDLANSEQDVEATTTEESTNEVTTEAKTSTFDINSIAVSNEDMGSFPYLSAPDGYEYADEHNKKYEEKYFFFNDSLVTTVGGKYYHAKVYPKEGEDFAETYIVKNYEQAIKKVGGVQVYSGKVVPKLHDLLSKHNMSYTEDMYNPYPYDYKQYVVRTPKGNVWFEVSYGYNMEGIDFTVMYEGDLEETIQIVKADELKEALDKDGKAVLYINFETDKSALKPDGVLAVEEIGKLLKDNATLKLSIEGHTDNTGAADHNKKLSLSRAESVVGKLNELGIQSARLKVKGYGSEKPLAANDSEENKAKNRRVEIVKI